MQRSVLTVYLIVLGLFQCQSTKALTDCPAGFQEWYKHDQTDIVAGNSPVLSVPGVVAIQNWQADTEALESNGQGPIEYYGDYSNPNGDVRIVVSPLPAHDMIFAAVDVVTNQFMAAGANDGVLLQLDYRAGENGEFVTDGVTQEYNLAVRGRSGTSSDDAVCRGGWLSRNFQADFTMGCVDDTPSDTLPGFENVWSSDVSGVSGCESCDAGVSDATSVTEWAFPSLPHNSSSSTLRVDGWSLGGSSQWYGLAGWRFCYRPTVDAAPLSSAGYYGEEFLPLVTVVGYDIDLVDGRPESSIPEGDGAEPTSAMLELGFDMQFFCATYDRVWVGANGLVSFVPFADAGPGSFLPMAALSPWWMDYALQQESEYMAKVEDDAVHLLFQDLEHEQAQSVTWSFGVSLHANGVIDFHYIEASSGMAVAFEGAFMRGTYDQEQRFDGFDRSTTSASWTQRLTPNFACSDDSYNAANEDFTFNDDNDDTSDTADVGSSLSNILFTVVVPVFLAVLVVGALFVAVRSSKTGGTSSDVEKSVAASPTRKPLNTGKGNQQSKKMVKKDSAQQSSSRRASGDGKKPKPSRDARYSQMSAISMTTTSTVLSRRPME